MKTLISALILVFLITGTAFGQDDFKVIKVSGSILLKTRGISLETGTVFSGKEDLLFRSQDATAAVINSQKGRLVLTSNSHDLSSAKSNFMPAMYNISSRGGSINNSKDLSSRFSGKYVVLDRQNNKIDGKVFPMDKDHFFFLRYIYKGEEINKKLMYSGDTLIIEKKNLFTVDGNPIPSADNTSIRLFYRKGSESVFISQFDLIFPDQEQLKKETGIILTELKAKSASVKISEVGSYINDFYGKVDRGNLTAWLKSNFGIKE